MFLGRWLALIKRFLTYTLAYLGFSLMNNEVNTNISQLFTNQITFQLYFGPSPGNYINIPFKEGLSLPDYPAFNASHKTIFYYPGWGEVAKKERLWLSIETLVTAFRTLPETNLVVMDYVTLIEYTSYYSAMYNSSIIGDAMAQFFDQYVQQIQPVEKIHLIGHSLGSTIVSNTARSFKALGHPGFVRLTGMDPAAVGYSTTANHLRNTDAEYVDVIHTNIPTVGTYGSYGTIDFYPNGGIIQPYCVYERPWDVLCNHAMAWRYYNESIFKPRAFASKKCDEICSVTPMQLCSCKNSEIAYMGYHIEPTKKGTYFFKTDRKSPFGLGAQGLNFGIKNKKK